MTYRSRSTRRTKASINVLKAKLYAIIEELRPMTVRQVFYQAVSRGLIDKTEAEYKQTIGRLLTTMRKEGELPWHWLADHTRWMRKPTTHDNLTAMMERSQEFYRRALWNDQDAYVEVWLEKDALAGVLYDVTEQWDVPLMVTRGYPSFSFMASAAQTIAAQDKPVHLYYFGDHDPSGVDIPRHVEQQIKQLVYGIPEEDMKWLKSISDNQDDDWIFSLLFGDPIRFIELLAEKHGTYRVIHFTRVAVNEDQIVELDLQTRPTKKTDSRARNFKGESVEVDAIHPNMLRRMVENCITQHIDEPVLENTRKIEQAERETLQTVISNMGGGE